MKKYLYVFSIAALILFFFIFDMAVAVGGSEIGTSTDQQSTGSDENVFYDFDHQYSLDSYAPEGSGISVLNSVPLSSGFYGDTSLSVSYEVLTGADLLAVFAWSHDELSMTFNGTALTCQKVVTGTLALRYGYFCYLNSPTVGSHTLASNVQVQGVALSLSGAASTGVLSAYDGSNVSATSDTVSLAQSDSDGLILGALLNYTVGSPNCSYDPGEEMWSVDYADPGYPYGQMCGFAYAAGDSSSHDYTITKVEAEDEYVGVALVAEAGGEPPESPVNLGTTSTTTLQQDLQISNVLLMSIFSVLCLVFTGSLVKASV